MPSSKETVDQYLAELRNYQRKELHKLEMGKLGTLVVTGKLAIGLVGFVIIVLVLAATFNSLASRYDITDVGGGSSLQADVITITEDCDGCTKSGTFNEGDTVDFGVDFGEDTWDFSNYTNLYQVIVIFQWDASTSTVDGFSPTVSFTSHTDVHDEQSKSGSGFNSAAEITFDVNPAANGTITATTDDVESWKESLEVPGVMVSGTISYDDDGNPSPIKDEPLDYTITADLILWDLANIDILQT